MTELNTYVFSYDDDGPRVHDMKAVLFNGETVQVAWGDSMWGYETPDGSLVFVDFAHPELDTAAGEGA